MNSPPDRYTTAVSVVMVLVFVLVFAGVRVDAQTAGAQSDAIQTAPTAAPPAQTTERRLSTYDRLWTAFSQWYKDDSNPVLQQILFSGRYQHEFVTLGADEGNHDEWNVRRMRLGPKLTMFRTLTVHAEVELNPQERDPLYVRFTDAYVQWAKSASRGNRRQARCSVHDGWSDVLEGAARDRSQQLEQQPLVSPNATENPAARDALHVPQQQRPQRTRAEYVRKSRRAGSR